MAESEGRCEASQLDACFLDIGSISYYTRKTVRQKWFDTENR